MRKLLVGVAVAAFLGTAGTAAAGGMYEEDEGSLKDTVEPVAPVAIWSGLYVGGSLGFGVGDSSGQLKFEKDKRVSESTELDALRVEQEGPDGPSLSDFLSSDVDIDGAIYGAHVGYNWQHGHKVFGVEAGINGTDIDGSALCGPFGIATCERELNYYATLVGRLGYAVDNLLFYGFGGVAWGDVDTDVSLLGAIPLFDGNTSHVGWTGGVGVEMAFTERFSAGVEYAHVDLGEEDFTVVDGYGVSIKDEVDMDFDVIKIRASYKLWDRDYEPIEDSYK